MAVMDVLLLCLVIALLAALPSTSVALVVASTLTAGVSRGVAASFGIALVDVGFMLMALLGMGALAGILGNLFVGVKILAGAYLLWFGFTLLHTSAERASKLPAVAQSMGGSFLTGVLITLGDVKAIVFYASLLPLFINLPALDTQAKVILIACVAVTVVAVKLLYVVAIYRVQSVPAVSLISQFWQRCMGGLLLAIGAWLIISQTYYLLI